MLRKIKLRRFAFKRSTRTITTTRVARPKMGAATAVSLVATGFSTLYLLNNTLPFNTTQCAAAAEIPHEGVYGTKQERTDRMYSKHDLLPLPYQNLMEEERDNVLCKGQEFTTTQDLNLHIKMYLIRTGRLNYTKRSENRRRIEVRCPQLMIVARRDNDFKWKVKKLDEELEKDEDRFLYTTYRPMPTFGTTMRAYCCRDLAVALKEAISVANSLTQKECKAILQIYLPPPLKDHSSYILGIYKAAQRLFIGSHTENAKFLPALAEDLERKNYIVSLKSTNQRKLREIKYTEYSIDYKR